MSGKYKQKVKNITVTIVVPIVVFLIMDAICVFVKQTHLITSMLDVNNLIRNIGITCALAYALSFNLSCGRFDLSLGAQRLVGTIVGGSIALSLGLSGVWLLVFAIISGIIFGFITGIVFVWTRVPPMVLGIGMGLVYECIAFTINGSSGLELFGVKGMKTLADPTFVIFVVIFMCVSIIFITSSTKFGYQLRAIQGSQKIAQSSGIKIFRHTVLCYTIAGGVVNVSGMMSAAMSNGMEAGLGFISNGAVMASCFPMMFGNVMAKWSNSGIGILSATIAIRFFASGLNKLELSESMVNAINMLAFLALLVYQANEHFLVNRKAEKARIAEAMVKKAGLASKVQHEKHFAVINS